MFDCMYNLKHSVQNRISRKILLQNYFISILFFAL